MTTDKTKFRPVTGRDEVIQSAPKNPGWVYFASDTGKIYFDLDVDTRVAMGGSGVSLLYGRAGKIEPDEYSLYHLSFDDLEDEDITPKEGDLVLNTDGIFYRVQEVLTDERTMACTIMSVSGGGGGGGGGANYSKKIGIKIEAPATSNLINGQEIGVKFTATSGVDVDGSQMDDKLTVYWKLEAKTGTSYTLYEQGMLDVVSGVVSTFDAGEKLRPNATTRITMYAYGINSGESASKYIEVACSELKLEEDSNFSALTRYAPDQVQLACNAIGSMNKILKYYFDGQLIHTAKLNASAESFQTFQVPEQYATHGSHKARIELWQAIVLSGQWNEGIMVTPIEFEIGVFEAGNVNPVIWLGPYQSEYYNYDPIKIPFLVYDPANTASAKIVLKKNGNEIASSPRTIDTSSLDKWNIFEITDADLDRNNKYSIGCGETERQISFLVSKDPNRTMEPVKQPYLQMSFDSKGRSNNESAVNRETWVSADGAIKAEFKDFNWYNNGWVLDDDNNTCLRISNGAQFTLPIGEMTFASSSGSKQSNSIEVQFKVRNVQDYSNLIHNVTRYVNDTKFYNAFKAQTQYNNYDAFLQYYLPIYELGEKEERKTYDSLEFDKVQKEISLDRVACGYYSGDESGAIGMAIGPQDAFFSNGINTVNVNFVEDRMVNISMVYSHTSKLIYIYINGVITGVIESTAGSDFTISNPNMVFNSRYCDIDLYKIRIYNTDLNVNDIVTNFAVDHRDITTYDQNKLAQINNAIAEYQFKYEKMIEYNETHPDGYLMPYIIFDTTPTNNGNKLSYSKKTKLNIGVEFVNTGLDRAFQTGELEKLAKEEGFFNDESTDEQKVAAIKDYYKYHCPSWKSDAGVEMAVQGTSSEFYPRRNYKLKTKTKYDSDEKERTHIFLHKGPWEETYNKEMEAVKNKTLALGDETCRQSFWYLDNYTNGTTKWTMKVDFMESSGSYNTGFANLVANGYSKHPLKDYIDGGAFSDPTLLDSPVTHITNWKDYRTSVQGFPVLAFHKKAKGDKSEYLFIGLYRMNLDKGSDEVYGFKPNKNLLAKYVDNKPVRDIVECWEFCNNNRGFCSFRDPWDRMELSFKAPTGVSNEFNADLAPWIMDNVEYRYNTHEKAWDLLFEMKKASADKIKSVITDKYGMDYHFDPASNDYEGGRKLALELYKNWEEVNKWVWSTNTDKVPSQGTYSLVNVGNVDYVPDTFYTFNEESGEYELATGDYVFNEIYFTRSSEEVEDAETGEIEYVYTYSNAYAVGPELKYEPGKFYYEENGAYAIITDAAFDSSMDYYMLEENDEYKTKTDLLVQKCNDEAFNAEKTYYNYDGTQTEAGKCVTEAEVTADNYEPGKFYEAIEVTYGNKTFAYDTKEYRAAKFTNELEEWFDLEYLATYFIMTEVFECYDSRGKNAMWASWGPVNAQATHYKWYPIFYDIDTQLGINNTGIPSFEYNVDATEAGNYSTSDSVLWNNFYKYFKNSYILMKYKHLKGVTDGVTWRQLDHAPLYSIERIEGWYHNDPEVTGSFASRGERPLIATNLDEYYKYITITNPLGVDLDGITGHIASNTTGTYTYDPNGTYFYALQGDRSLSRQQFLTNRIEYIDSWLNQGNYQRGGANRIRGRVAANNAEKTSDIWVESASAPYYDESGKKKNRFDAEYWLNLTPIRSSYVTVSDDAEAYPSRKYDGINPVKFNIDAIEAGVRRSANYPEQLLYVYGMNQMADLGDMSNLYWQEFEISGNAQKLTTLKIGYDGLMETSETKEELQAKGYPSDKITEKDGKCYISWYNNKVNQPSIPSSKKASGMPLLKEVNFSNVTINTGSPSLDLSSCEKLQNFRATGSNFIDLTFAEGAAMHTCYLPSTINKLDLVECNLLRNLITEYEAPTADVHGNLTAKPGLYIQGMFEGEGASVINYFSIKGGSLGYDSYKLLKQYYTIRARQTAMKSQITLTDVKWSPYVQLVEGDSYDSKSQYFVDDGHYGFTPYTYNAGTFATQVLNGELYRLDSSIAASVYGQIDSVEMLEKFIDDNLYVGTNEGSKCPNITGIIYVNNETPIDELTVRNKLVKNYPYLTFFFKNVNQVNSARFILLDTETGLWDYVPNKDANNFEPSIQKIKNGWFTNPYTLYAPEKDNYDFHGWSTTPDMEGLISSSGATAKEQDDAWKELSLEEGKTTYTFYAIFTIKSWNINFWAGPNKNQMTLVDSYPIVHGQDMYETTKIPSIPETNLSDTDRYRFLGWTQNENNVVVENAASAKLVNIPSMIATEHTDFYAVFTQENVYASATDEKYFDIQQTTYIDQYTQETLTGYVLSPKVTLSGKITLPTEYEDASKGWAKGPILQVGGFKGSNITHVYWYGEPKVVELLQNSFAECMQLKVFEMPKSMRKLSGSSFNSCSKLTPPNLENTQIHTIANYVFQGAFEIKDSIPVYTFPATLKSLGNNTFAYFINISGGSGPAIQTINFGKPGAASQLTSIGTTPFIQNERTFGDVNIYVSGGTPDPNLQALVGRTIAPFISGTVSYPSA